MKFPDLSIGTRFRFQGKTYTKVGPLAATAEDGGQRIIPRYAVLQPVDGAPPTTAPAPDTGPEAALAVYHATCRELLQAACPDTERRDALQAQLDAAYRRCLEAFKPVPRP